MINAIIYLNQNEVFNWVSLVLARQGKTAIKEEISYAPGQPTGPFADSPFYLTVPMFQAAKSTLSADQVFEMMLEEATFRGYTVSPVGGTMTFNSQERNPIGASLIIQLPDQLSRLQQMELKR